MLHVVVEAEIQRRIRVRGGDDVPAGAAAADMVQRREAAGDVIGLVEGGRCGGDQADPLGHGGERREQGERFERGDGVAALQRIDRHVQHGQMVGHEERVKFSTFQRLDETFEMRQVEIRVRKRAGVAPRPGVKADGTHERAEAQLTFFGHRSIPPQAKLNSSEIDLGRQASGARVSICIAPPYQ